MTIRILARITTFLFALGITYLVIGHGLDGWSLLTPQNFFKAANTNMVIADVIAAAIPIISISLATVIVYFFILLPQETKHSNDRYDNLFRFVVVILSLMVLLILIETSINWSVVRSAKHPLPLSDLATLQTELQLGVLTAFVLEISVAFRTEWSADHGGRS